MPVQKMTATGDGAAFRPVFAPPPEQSALLPVLTEIRDELKAIRAHMDRAKWLGPEGEAFLKKLTDEAP